MAALNLLPVTHLEIHIVYRTTISVQFVGSNGANLLILAMMHNMVRQHQPPYIIGGINGLL